ncbi:hypothetical protein JCM21900_006409 [Sporobolomyces salmonicolor]
MRTLASSRPAAAIYKGIVPRLEPVKPIEIDNLSSKLHSLEVAIAAEGAAAVARQTSTHRQLAEILAHLGASQRASPSPISTTLVDAPELAALSALVTDLAFKVGKLELWAAQFVEAPPALKSEVCAALFSAITHRAKKANPGSMSDQTRQVFAPGSCACAKPTHSNNNVNTAALQSEAEAGMPALFGADNKAVYDSAPSPFTPSAAFASPAVSVLEKDASTVSLTESEADRVDRALGYPAAFEHIESGGEQPKPLNPFYHMEGNDQISDACAWMTSEEATSISFVPGTVRDTTQDSKKKYPNAGRDMYLSAGITMSKNVDGRNCDLPALCLKGVLLKLQVTNSNAASNYGKSSVRMAVREHVITAIRTACTGKYAIMPSDMDSGTPSSYQGHKYYTFNPSLTGVAIKYRGDEVREVDLPRLLSAGQKDIVASVAFKVNLQYGGPAVGVHEAEMSVSLDPLFIHIVAISDGAIE